MAKAMDQTKPIKAITHRRQTKQPQKPEKPPSSWSPMRGLFSFRQQHHPQKQKPQEQALQETSKKCKKMRCSGSLCSNTKVMHRPETSLSQETAKRSRPNSTDVSSSSSSSSSSRSMKAPLRELNDNNGGSSSSAAAAVVVSSSNSLSVNSSSSNSSVGIGGSFKGMPFRRFYGCYECRMVVDPVLGITKDPSLRTTICSCPDCGEIFRNAENLELHQGVRHAVSELGPDDTSKNIVDIIFQSSWLRNQTPICKIDRILKVHNTHRTISKFEEYRDSIKSKAAKLPKKNPRCVADGNELLRFHCTTVSCQLGLHGSTNLCNSDPNCHVCSIIKNGFKIEQEKGSKIGILTTATSGRAHESAGARGDGGGGREEEKKAMLVCRVIAGRVRKVGNGEGDNNVGEEYDSLAGEIGVYSNLDELYASNPKAILPCFVVIYSL